MTVILASASPRRRELLGRLDVPFEVVPSGVEEPPPEADEDPVAYASRLSRLKALDVARRRPGEVVLGADTVVAVDGTILGKPRDRDDALRMLRALGDRWHTVVTAVTVARDGEARTDAEVARVHMHAAPDGELRAYIDTGEPMDKAGAYGIQGEGGRLVDGLEGCYNAVVGLPLGVTAALLRSVGIEVAPKPPSG